MNIGIHANEFNGRGTGKVPLDYALALEKYYHHKIVMISSGDEDTSGYINIPSRFTKITYGGSANKPSTRKDVKTALEFIVDSNKLDFLYMVKWGINDNITPSNCRVGVHCVFEMTEPHGNVYAGVSEYIAKKFKQPLCVPHIIKKYELTSDKRTELQIPKDATVLGRLGGVDNFNLPFVKQAVIDVLKYRTDLYFVFLSTNKFIDHNNIKFIPWVSSEQEKYNYIHACDAMLHARADGETFGLSIGEFSACNKPIITWSGMSIPAYDTCHLDILGKKAIIYHEYSDLIDILYSIKREDTISRQWDVYSEQFSEENVIEKFNSVFLS